MKNTPGHIYFLKERDYLTGAVSPYVKIGLVRDTKETATRIKEHQTGNPREIIDYTTLPMRFVEHAETLLHYAFGEQWITGEWFQLDETQLQEAIQYCQKLAEEQEQIAADFITASEMKTCESNGEIIPPTQEVLQLHEQLIALQDQLFVTDGQLKLIKNQLLQAAGSSQGIEKVLDTKLTPPSTTWNKKAFLEKYTPEFYAPFMVSKEKLKGTFKVIGKNNLKKVDEALAEKVKESAVDTPSYDALSDRLIERSSHITDLHLQYIQHNKTKYELEWEVARLEYQLKVHLGKNEEIEGVVKWPRSIAVSEELDTKALQAAHPTLIEEFTVPKPGSVSYLVRNWREYA